MRTIALSIITAASTILPVMTVLQYEARTGLHQNWITNQALVEQRVHLSQTNNDTGETNEQAKAANIQAIRSYSDAYLCASKKDTSKCKLNPEF